MQVFKRIKYRIWIDIDKVSIWKEIIYVMYHSFSPSPPFLTLLTFCGRITVIPSAVFFKCVRSQHQSNVDVHLTHFKKKCVDLVSMVVYCLKGKRTIKHPPPPSPVQNLTRGPLATSPTWENSSNDNTIPLNKRRKKTIINFMRIYWFFIWRNLNPLHSRMLCAKILWNWLSGSGEEDILVFNYLPLKKDGTLHLNKLDTQGCYVKSLVEIGPVVLEKNFF